MIKSSTSARLARFLRGLWAAFLLVGAAPAHGDELKPWPADKAEQKPESKQPETKQPDGKKGEPGPPPPAKKVPDKADKPAKPPAVDAAQEAKDKAEAACLAGCNTAQDQGVAACGDASVLPADEDCEKTVKSAAGRCRAGCHK